MRFAVSSQNFRTVTKHASKTRRFLVYEVTAPDQIEEVDRIDLEKEQSLYEVNRDSHHPIFDMDYLIVGSCGDNFISRLAKQNVIVCRSEQSDPKEAIIDCLSQQKAS